MNACVFIANYVEESEWHSHEIEEKKPSKYVIARQRFTARVLWLSIYHVLISLTHDIFAQVVVDGP